MIEGIPLAVFKKREPGAKRLVEIKAGSPSLVVEFTIPDGLKLAEAEAAAQQAMALMRQQPQQMARYGLEQKALSDLQVRALTRLVTAVESAVLLWTAWNYAVIDADENAAPVQLDARNIAELLSDPDARAAWLVHLDNASPLERAEGNVSAASLNGSSAEAANTAEAATPEAQPAPEASQQVEESSAPA